MFDRNSRAAPTNPGRAPSAHALPPIPEYLRAVVNHLVDPTQFPVTGLTKDQREILNQICNSDSILKGLKQQCKKIYLLMDLNDKKIALIGDTTAERNIARQLFASNKALAEKIEAINAKIGKINDYLKVCAPYSDPASPAAQSHAEHLRSLMREYSDGQSALLKAKNAGALKVSGARLLSLA